MTRKKNKPKELSAIFDDIREANCDLCHDLEHSKLPQQLAMATKEVNECRKVLPYHYRQSMPGDIKLAKVALRKAETRHARLNKRLLAFMLQSNEKLLTIVIAFSKFSTAVKKGDYIAG